MYHWSGKSKSIIATVHPDLQKVLHRFIEITQIDATVIEGIRTLNRQKYLVQAGASRTLNSRHLTGHAVDLAPFIDGKVSWDWINFYPLAKYMKEAAKIENVRIEWGGNWTTFRDGPHFQLPWV